MKRYTLYLRAGLQTVNWHSSDDVAVLDAIRNQVRALSETHGMRGYVEIWDNLTGRRVM